MSEVVHEFLAYGEIPVRIYPGQDGELVAFWDGGVWGADDWSEYVELIKEIVRLVEEKKS